MAEVGKEEMPAMIQMQSSYGGIVWSWATGHKLVQGRDCNEVVEPEQGSSQEDNHPVAPESSNLRI